MNDQVRWILVAVAGVNASALLLVLLDWIIGAARDRRSGRAATRDHSGLIANAGSSAFRLPADDPLAALVAAAEQADGTRLEGTRGEDRLIADIARWRLRAGGGPLPETADSRRSPRIGTNV